MKLKSFRVGSFQSIRDSGLINIDQIACLVGKNESGKSAILKALYKLNPIIEADRKFSVTDDYPRRDVDDYRERVENGEHEHDIVISAFFHLEDKDIQKAADEYGLESFKSRELSLSKGYSNILKYAFKTDEASAVDYLINNADLPQSVIETIEGSAKTFESLQQILLDTEQTEETKALLKLVKGPADKGFSSYIFNSFINQNIPKFLYFDEYYQMSGQENIEELLARKQTNKLKSSDHPMLGLINTARLDLEALKNAQKTQDINNRLEGASNRLTRRTLKYWSQNKHIRLKFDVRPARPQDPVGMTTGTNIWGQVEDKAHWVTTNLGARSRGFIWFFSFLAWYEDVKKDDQSLILLLDEPGTSLHGKAQGDLLGYIETELKGHHQIIYTTHSPFMVDPNHFDRVRIVQDKSIDAEYDLPEDEEGTKVLKDVYDANEDSLFPLQGALGYDIHQTLFIGPNSLVVEGPSDLIYLQCMSSLLESEGREGLDSRWVITPVGGAAKVPTFVALLAPQSRMNVATLLDIDPSIQQEIENLYKKKLLSKKQVLTFGDFTGSTSADIEDLFERKFYLDLVNAEFKSQLRIPIKVGELNSMQPRILKSIDEYLKKTPFKTGKFGHFRPARYFSENLSKLQENLGDNVKDRFEEIFKQLNSLIAS